MNPVLRSIDRDALKYWARRVSPGDPEFDHRDPPTVPLQKKQGVQRLRDRLRRELQPASREEAEKIIAAGLAGKRVPRRPKSEQELFWAAFYSDLAMWPGWAIEKGCDVWRKNAEETRFPTCAAQLTDPLQKDIDEIREALKNAETILNYEPPEIAPGNQYMTPERLEEIKAEMENAG